MAETLTHGLTDLTVQLEAAPAGEDAFDAFAAAFAQELQPQGLLEGSLFEQLVHAAWAMRRMERGGLRIQRDAAADRAYAAQERLFSRALKELRTIQTNRMQQKVLGLDERLLTATGSVLKVVAPE